MFRLPWRSGATCLVVGPALIAWPLTVFSAGGLADELMNRETIAVFGDSQAAGLARGLQRVLINDRRYHILNRTHAGAALVHPESEWVTPIQRFVATEKADIALIMFGGNDRVDMRDTRGNYLHFGTDAWRDVYADRVQRILQLLTGAGLKVTWCGNPIARSTTYSADMSYINKIYEDNATRSGAQFVPLWPLTTDDEGRYVAYGKDREGVMQRLRADDGIHFTEPGYELVATKILDVLAGAGPHAE